MYEQKLGIGTFGELDVDNNGQIKLFKKVGFEAFFTEWKYGCDVDSWVKTAKNEGMIYQSIHAPFGKSDDMWHGDSELVKIAVDELLACLKDCAKYEVPIMVLHSIIGMDNHSPNQQGIDNFGIIVKEAEKLGVKLAFENTEGEEYLFTLFDAFKNEKYVGFCWDSGHEMCYNRSQDLLAKLGDRLIATHINDNLGIKDYNGEITWLDDLHLLPFDGVADWQNNVERLNKCGFNDILTFELNVNSKPNRHENDLYMKMSFEEYLSEAYKRACKIAVMKNK